MENTEKLNHIRSSTQLLTTTPPSICTFRAPATETVVFNSKTRHESLPMNAAFVLRAAAIKNVCDLTQ